MVFAIQSSNSYCSVIGVSRAVCSATPSGEAPFGEAPESETRTASSSSPKSWLRQARGLGGVACHGGEERSSESLENFSMRPR